MNTIMFSTIVSMFIWVVVFIYFNPKIVSSAPQSYETVKLYYNYDAKYVPGMGGFISKGCARLSEAIMSDLRENLRQLTQPQNYKDPRILFHGTSKNPDFCQLFGKRTWTDPESNQLWTVALTEQNPSNIIWCLHYAMRGCNGGSVVIFEVIPKETEEINGTEFGELLPKHLEHSTSMIGRISDPEGLGTVSMVKNNKDFDVNVHPDSYILTKEFQKKHTVRIRRIYKLIDVAGISHGPKVKKNCHHFEYATSSNAWYKWCT